MGTVGYGRRDAGRERGRDGGARESGGGGERRRTYRYAYLRNVGRRIPVSPPTANPRARRRPPPGGPSARAPARTHSPSVRIPHTPHHKHNLHTTYRSTSRLQTRVEPFPLEKQWAWGAMWAQTNTPMEGRRSSGRSQPQTHPHGPNTDTDDQRQEKRIGARTGFLRAAFWPATQDAEHLGRERPAEAVLDRLRVQAGPKGSGSQARPLHGGSAGAHRAPSAHHSGGEGETLVLA